MTRIAPLEPPVGGFFGAELPVGAAREDAISRRWRIDPARTPCFANARSALAWLLRETGTRRVWLPAYICDSVLAGACASRTAVEFFPVGETMEPETGFLDRHLKRGDTVLAVDYFGRLPAARFRNLVRARRDIRWIEDRAQALDTGGKPWGDWELFSPRKLLGVPDGGVIVSRSRERCGSPSRLGVSTEDGMLYAQALRATGSAGAYRAFQRSESAQSVCRNAMSDWSKRVLAATDLSMHATRRKANYRMLQALLGFVAFHRRPGVAAPFAFPIRVADAAELQAKLVAHGVYAQRHWARLPSPSRRFPEAHLLARQLVSLPCDHRYGEGEMRAVAAVVRACLH